MKHNQIVSSQIQKSIKTSTVTIVTIRLKTFHSVWSVCTKHIHTSTGYTNNAYTRDVEFEFEWFDWNVRDVHRVMFWRNGSFTAVDGNRLYNYNCSLHCTAPTMIATYLSPTQRWCSRNTMALNECSNCMNDDWQAKNAFVERWNSMIAYVSI